MKEIRIDSGGGYKSAKDALSFYPKNLIEIMNELDALAKNEQKKNINLKIN